ncbi:MAG: nicotinate-nucleotide adenylyltransferase [Clostridia bacterium]|nr:nicotinate-nucleotide adenylyltransferase [Clostridia bacterium]
MAKEHIGIMGGTLDPIHEGHIRMARAAAKTVRLDRIIMLPTGNPPHKTNISPAEDRWRMLCAATAKEPMLEPSRMEMDREGVIYTVDTLREIQQQNPKAELYYMIGSDTLLDLKNWRNYEQVLTMCRFLVCPRPWDASPEEITEERKRLTAMGGKFISVDMEPVDVASSELRKALCEDKPAPHLPVVCATYARLAGLYGIAPHLDRAEEWLGKLFADLTVKRFAHTLAVTHTARQLAMLHGVDVKKAEVAAVLHDCAKCMPLKEMQAICREHSLTDDPAVLESGALMHSLVGAYLASEKYGVEDPDILHAIANHTTGCAEMTRLDMVVYLADKIEPTRDPYPTLDRVRMLAQLSL